MDRVPLTAAAEATFRFGRRSAREAVRGVSLDLRRGEIVGVVGPAGSGKTTLLRLLTGRLKPLSGRVSILGKPAHFHRVRCGACFVPDPPVIPRHLSGHEWLRYLAAHRAADPGGRLALVRSATGVGRVSDFAHLRIGSLSRGMVGQLALAGATIVASDVMALDETLSGIDPIVVASLRESLGRFAGNGRGILVSSHDLSTLERIATRVVVMSEGRIVASTSLAALLRRRIAEIAVQGGSLASVRELSRVFPGSDVTGSGIAVPLERGLTLEKILAVCRENRIAVSGSRVRYRMIEDLLLESVRNTPRN